MERAGDLLLVCNRRRDGRIDWSPPGGVIDAGEGLLAGLGREVQEETGLVVTRWRGPVYVVEADAPDMAWHLRVEVHLAEEITGELAVEDPDGIVEDAAFVASGDLGERLASAPRWVAEPLLEWLSDRPPAPSTYRYEVRGTLGDGLRVRRRP